MSNKFNGNCGKNFDVPRIFWYTSHTYSSGCRERAGGMPGPKEAHAMVTIYDIAKQAGVSPPTVSKALNGSGNLKAKTRELIVTAAREMGYVPNLTARALSTRRSRLIGIINKDIYQSDAFVPPIFNNILGGFNQVMEKQGYDLLLISGSREFLTGSNYRNIDGLLILSIPGEEEYNSLLQYRWPCVSANDIIPGISAVITDNAAGAERAVQYLADLGHRNIAYIAGPETSISTASADRFQGYRSCLAKNGLPWESALTEHAALWSAQGGYEAALRLAGMKKPFSALFTASDALAYGAMRALREAGLAVPGDVSVVGFDGDRLGEYVSPSLTTMRQDAVEIGVKAAELLLKKLSSPEDREAGIIRLPAELVIRSSCAVYGAANSR